MEYTRVYLTDFFSRQFENRFKIPMPLLDKSSIPAVMVVNLELIFQPQNHLSRPNLVLCCSQISLACVFENKNLSVFRSLRTLRALRPLRAISRMEGMKVTDAEFVY